MRRGSLDDSRPLLLILLPVTLEDFAQREPVEQLLAAPGVVAVDPPRVAALGDVRGQAVAQRQAKRLRLPGYPRAVAVFDERQLPLAGALIERHPEAELWSLGPRTGRTPTSRSTSRPRPTYARRGSGWSGSASSPGGSAPSASSDASAGGCAAGAPARAPTASSVHVTGSSRNAA